MNIMEAVRARHSVRSYQEKPLDPAHRAELSDLIEQLNRQSGLHMQLVADEPKAFSSFLAHYGVFSGVTNYIALVGPKSDDLEQKCGYFGERLVLRAQQLGLNTCWVALTFRKIPDAFEVLPGEKLTCVIALGYGKTQGKPHRSKPLASVVENKDIASLPDWFVAGVESALLAPTAVNRQAFRLALDENRVTLKPGRGFCTGLDLGIVKYHFELGAQGAPFMWA